MAEKPVIQVRSSETVGDLDEFGERVFSALASTGRCFRKPSENNLIYYFPNDYSLPVPADRADFFGILHDLVTFQAAKEGVLFPCILAERPVKFLFSCHHRHLLPPFEIVLTEPAVFHDPAGKPFIPDLGYNSSTQSYSLQSSLKFERMSGVEHIKRAFSGVPFASAGFFSNVVAYLLGAVVYDRNVEPPLMAITGNQPGIGKTKLASAIGYVLTGCEPPPICYTSENDLDKQIGARFNAGQRVICIDNITTEGNKPFSHSGLAMHITAGLSKSVRQLGLSRNITMRGVQFCLTANHCTLDEDLTVRAIMVRLHREELSVMVPYVMDQVYQYRKEIYGELLNLALSTPNGKFTGLEDQFFRFRGWLQFVRPRLAGLFEPLDLATGLTELDQDFYTLCEWVADGGFDKIRENIPFSAGDLLPVIRGDLAPNSEQLRYLYFRLHGKVDRSRSKSLSTFLSRFIGKSCTLPTAIVDFSLAPSSSMGVKQYVFKVKRTE